MSEQKKSTGSEHNEQEGAIKAVANDYTDGTGMVGAKNEKYASAVPINTRVTPSLTNGSFHRSNVDTENIVKPTQSQNQMLANASSKEQLKKMSAGKQHQLELVTMIQKPETTHVNPKPHSGTKEEDEDLYSTVREKLNTHQGTPSAGGGNGAGEHSNGMATEYLAGVNAGAAVLNNGNIGSSNVSHSNGELMPISGTQSPKKIAFTPGVPTITTKAKDQSADAPAKKADGGSQTENPKRSSATKVGDNALGRRASLSKREREGKLIPAVDFMHMNKTMINFNNNKEPAQSKADLSPDDSKKNRALKQSPGAFRHTEYAKGFYKVSGTNHGPAHTTTMTAAFTNETTSARNSIGALACGQGGAGALEHTTNVTGGFSDAERSIVLDNQTRKPLAQIVFGHGSTKHGGTISNASPANMAAVQVSRFNQAHDNNQHWASHQKTSKIMPRLGKDGDSRYGGGVAHNSLSSRRQSNAKTQGSQKETFMSFGRSIGGGGSLQPKSLRRQRKTHERTTGARNSTSRNETFVAKTTNADDMSRSSRHKMPSLKVNGAEFRSSRIAAHPSSQALGCTEYAGSQTSRIHGYQKQGNEQSNKIYPNSATNSETFRRRNQSVIHQGMAVVQSNLGSANEVGNFGHSVSKITPKDFTLTPVHRLKPMAFDMHKLPIDMRVTSNEEETDLTKVRQKLRRQRFDHLNYDPFVNTNQGQAMYKGVLELAESGAVNEDPQAAADSNETQNIYAFLINNGLVTHNQKRKRGDPIEEVTTRRDFGPRNKGGPGSADVVQKAKPISKLREIKNVYNRNDIKPPPMATINSRIDEHHEKQNTKEYLHSWLHQRRKIEQMLDDGYQVCVDENAGLNSSMFRNESLLRGHSQLQEEEAQGPSLKEQGLLCRVPSQTLSVLIHRRNLAAKKEKRRKEIALRKAKLEAEEELLEEAFYEGDGYYTATGEGLQQMVIAQNQSMRTMQAAVQNKSQMILSKQDTSEVNRRNPAWMVSSQVMTMKGAQPTPSVLPGKTRVITRRLNQVVKNPPSMASMGLKNTQMANLSPTRKKRKGNKILTHKASPTSNSQPHHAMVSATGGQGDEQTVQSTNFNADLKPTSFNNQTVKNQDLSRHLAIDASEQPERQELYRDSVANDAPLTKKYTQDLTSQVDGARNLTLETSKNDGYKSNIKVEKQNTSRQLGGRLDEPSFFETVPNVGGEQDWQGQEQASPQTKALNTRQVEQAQELMLLASDKGKAKQILQKYYGVESDGPQQHLSPNKILTATESLFSHNTKQQLKADNTKGLEGHRLDKAGMKAIVASDETIRVRDQIEGEDDALMDDVMSNYSVSQQLYAAGGAQPGLTGGGRLQEIDVNKKYYDCIASICNFDERIQSDLLQKKPHQPEGLSVNQAQQKRLRSMSSKRSGSQSSATATVNENAASRVGGEVSSLLSQHQLDVVVEKVDSASIGKTESGQQPTVRPQEMNMMADLTSESNAGCFTVNDDTRSAAIPYDIASSVYKGTLQQDSSAVSKTSRIKRKVANQIRELLIKIGELMDGSASNMDLESEGEGEQDKAQAQAQKRKGRDKQKVKEDGTAPKTVPTSSYYTPNPVLESFLIDRLAHVVELREETLSIEDFIADFLHFKEFNDTEKSIMEKLDSKKRQMAVNHQLFETEEACEKFRLEKRRQILVQKEQRTQVVIWKYDAKAKTRAYSLDQKMVRKAPLDLGVNAHKIGDPPKQHIDTRIPPYDVHKHFADKYKACHSNLIKPPTPVQELSAKKRDSGVTQTIDEVKQLASTIISVINEVHKTQRSMRRPKPKSNNLKLDDLGGKEKKYIVITLKEILDKDRVARERNK